MKRIFLVLVAACLVAFLAVPSVALAIGPGDGDCVNEPCVPGEDCTPIGDGIPDGDFVQYRGGR